MTETARLASNLSIVEQNIKIFSTIISETSIPGTESAQDAALLSKLDTSCRQMQSRLSALLSELDPESAGEVFMDALRINDELNNVFLRYERFCRSRPQNKSTRESSTTSPTTSEPATGMLIDLGSENSSGTHLTNQTSPQVAFMNFYL